MNKAFRIVKKGNGSTAVAHERAKSCSGRSLKLSLVGLAVASALGISSAAHAGDITSQSYSVSNSRDFVGLNYSESWNQNGLFSNTIRNNSIVVTGTGNVGSGNNNGDAVYLYNDLRNFHNPSQVDTLIQNNTLTNAGSLNGYNGSNGYGVFVGSRAEGASSAATIDRNTVVNSGHIYGYQSAIMLSAAAYGNVNTAASTISSNLIQNTASGKIYSYNNDAVSLVSYARGNIQATSSVNNNTIINSGLIDSYRGSNVTLAAYATAYKQANATVDRNTITNNGTIGYHNNGVDAINIQASATSFSNSYSANATVSNNLITNQGKIFGSRGVNIYADATGNSAQAVITSNTITNNGSIDASGNAIFMYISAHGNSSATAEITSNLITNTGSASIYGGSHVAYLSANSNADIATSRVSNNTFVNSGSLTTDHHAIHLASNAYGGSSSNAFASSNVIINNKGASVSSFDESIIVETSSRADLYAFGATSNAAIGSTNANTITNSGTLNSDNGPAINVNASAYVSSNARNNWDYRSHPNFDQNSYATSGATAIVSGNVITNTGSLNSINAAGISLIADTGGNYGRYASYANTNMSANITANGNFYDGSNQDTNRGFASAITTMHSTVSGNTIVNSGDIKVDGDGVFLSATSDAQSRARVDISNSYLSNVDAATFASSSSTSVVESNTITNSGSIKSANGDGIHLNANAYAKAEALTVARYMDSSINPFTHSGFGFSHTDYNNDGFHFIYNEAQATASSRVDNNLIVNTGNITAQNRGIGLDSTASSNVFESTDTTGSTWWSNPRPHQDPWSRNTHVDNYAKMVTTATVNQNTIINTGTITANGHGIELYANTHSQIIQQESSTNSGEDGGWHDPQYFGFHSNAYAQVQLNTIVNSGSITSGEDGIALLAYNHMSATQWAGASVDQNTIVNNGSIKAANDGISLHASSAAQWGAYAAITDNVIINNGLINAQVDGIHLETHTFTMGEDHQLLAGNTITNTGKIYAGEIGVYLNSRDLTVYNTINNSGLIVSTNPTLANQIAIRVHGSAYGDSNSINLTAPAFIGGKIQLDENARFNATLTSGASHSVNWTFDTTNGYGIAGGDNITKQGPLPWFTDESDGKRNYATIDPTAFANAANILADTSSMVSKMSKQGLDKADASAEKSSVWISAQGSRLDYDGDHKATLDSRTNLYGISVGYSQQLNDDLTVGALVGYNHNDLKANSRFVQSYDNKADGVFAGINARANLIGLLQVDLGLSGGYNSHDDNRFVNDNLWNLGQSHAKSSYNSTWVSPELLFSLPVNVFDSLVVAPRAGVRYTAQWIDSYTETGSDANAKVDSRSIGVLDTRVGVAVTKKFGQGKVSVTGDYMHRNNTGDNAVNVTMIGDSHSVSFFDRNVDAAILGADASFDVSNALSLIASGSWTEGSRVSGGSVSGNLKYNF